ncbi:hypothetical protein DM600_19935 [Escherichia coli]|nr:hypothetical protein [Escherichia coli]
MKKQLTKINDITIGTTDTQSSLLKVILVKIIIVDAMIITPPETIERLVTGGFFRISSMPKERKIINK